MAAPIAPRALEQAAEWLVRLQDGATEADHAACEQWRRNDPDNARAWERAATLLGKFDGLPKALAMPALHRPAAAGRRAAVARVAAAIAAIPAGWLGWRYAQSQVWAPDIGTAVGERRSVTLADGTQLTLNTASAVDIRYTATERLLLLRKGEIMIQTGHDGANRPFRVATAHGTLQALGTRFSVRLHDDDTALAVEQGAVRITPEHGQGLVVAAGQQSRYTASGATPPSELDAGSSAWTTGMLLADRMRLDRLVAELARYRGGYIGVDASVAGLPISGAFPVADSERALDMLVSTYPIDALSRLNGYWITLAPRQEK